MEARIRIDLKRIYATGFSHGGALANAVGCRRPDPEMGAATQAVSANDPIWSFFDRHSLTG